MMRLILLPQAITAMLPAIVGQLVVILKDTALGYIITYEELLRKAEQIGNYKSNCFRHLSRRRRDLRHRL